MDSVQQPHWSKRWMSVFLAWLSSLVMFAVLQGTVAQLGFEYNMNVAVFWEILGPPDEIYSFRNLALPKIVALIATFTPALLTGLVIYRSVLGNSWRLAFVSAAFLIGPCIGFDLASRFVGSSENTDVGAEVALSFVFALFLLCVTVAAGCLLEKASAGKM